MIYHMYGFVSFLIILLILEERYCAQRRILVNDIDVHQLQLDIQAMKAEIAALKTNFGNEVGQLKQTIQQLTTSGSGGATYVRWGRHDCPANGTSLVYEGFAAGGNFASYGSAAEYVCLTHDPDFTLGKTATNPYHNYAYIYGAEYEDNAFGHNIFDTDVPCAVCISDSATSIIMIPGKSVCLKGWIIEYKGFLASQASSSDYFKAAGQYVCVDSNAQSVEHSFKDEDGKLFYPVHAVCGSLPCPPYINNELLTCVVCSK